jgi:hypothetical protein
LFSAAWAAWSSGDRGLRDVLQTDGMEPTIRKYTNFGDMKDDEYRYWQSRPAHERFDAVDEMIETA